MIAPRILCFLPLALRGVVLVAVLALSPLYLTAHAMPQTDAAMPEMMAQHASPATGNLPTLHGNHDAACRIFCFGWVDAALPARSEDGLNLDAAVAELAARQDGIAPVPCGHPPKPPGIV